MAPSQEKHSLPHQAQLLVPLHWLSRSNLGQQLGTEQGAEAKSRAGAGGGPTAADSGIHNKGRGPARKPCGTLPVGTCLLSAPHPKRHEGSPTDADPRSWPWPRPRRTPASPPHDSGCRTLYRMQGILLCAQAMPWYPHTGTSQINMALLEVFSRGPRAPLSLADQVSNAQRASRAVLASSCQVGLKPEATWSLQAVCSAGFLAPEQKPSIREPDCKMQKDPGPG